MSVKIGAVEYEVIAEQDDGGGEYEWGFAALVRSPEGQLFLFRDGGCSCYGPWEEARASDLEPVASWQEAAERVKAEPPSLFTDADVVSFAEKLMALQPEPSAR